jgi:hypothetical protein
VSALSPSLPRPLAKRIDKLARRAHAFHRFAHHPLCDSYRSEVFRIGKRFRLCKGCSLLAGGLSLGIGLGALGRPSALVGFLAWAAAVLAGTASLHRRLPKLIARLLPGLGIGFAAWAGWTGAWLSLGTIVVCWILYRARGPQRSRCQTCHERERKPCSGLLLIVRRERAFQRRAGYWIDRHR